MLPTPRIVERGSVRVVPILVAVLLIAALGWLLWSALGSDAPNGTGSVTHSATADVPAQPRVVDAASDDAVVGSIGRTEVETPTAVLRGRFVVPDAPWPGGGRAVLVVADGEPRGAMGVFSTSMDFARREARNRARGLDAGDEFEREIASMLGRGEAVSGAEVTADGTFEFRDPPAGSFQVVLHHDILRVPEPKRVAIEYGTTHELGDIEVAWGATLIVRVVDADDRPVARAEVALKRVFDVRTFMTPEGLGKMGNVIGRFVPYEQTTDARGVCSFRGLQTDDPWILSVDTDGLVASHEQIRLLARSERIVTVRLARGAEVVVRVLDPAGAPFRGAHVGVSIPAFELPKQVVGMATAIETFEVGGVTGPDGEAAIAGLPPGHAVLSVHANGYRPASTEFDARPGEPSRVELQLDRGAVVAGRVTDAGGQPIARARVMSTTGGAFQFAGIDFESIQADMLRVKLYSSGIESDDAGAFELGGLDDGAVVGIVAVAPGYDLKRVDDVAVGTRDVVIALEPTASIRGVIVADADGAPVTSFEVLVRKPAFMMFDQTIASEKYEDAEEGRFDLEDVPRERVELLVEARGFAPATQQVDLGDGAVDVGEIRLHVPASLSGVTVDPDGEPIPRVSLRVAKGGAADSLMMAQMLGTEIVESDADGRFRFEGLAGKRVRLVADKDGYATHRTKPIPLEIGAETRDVRVVLDGGGSLRVHLVDEVGEPLAGWTCFASHTSGRSMRIGETDRNGDVVLVGLEPGPTKVDCMPQDFMTKMASMGGDDPFEGPSIAEITSKIGEAMRMVVSERVVIRSGEQLEVEFVFEGDRPERTAGVAVDGMVRVGSTALESGMIVITRAGATLPAGMAAVTDGAFSLDHLEPGTYRCQVRRGMLGGNVGDERVVDVPDRESHHIDIELPGGAIRGRIVDSEGLPVAGALVSLSSTGSSSSFDLMEFGEGTSLTVDDGRYEFAGLEDGTYEVVARTMLGARTRSARSGSVTVAAARVSDLDLTLGDGGTLRVAVRDANGPSRNAIVTVLDGNGQPMGLIQRSLTDHEGVVEFGALPAGRYRAVASAPGSAPRVSAEVEVVDDQVADVGIEVRAGVPTFVDLGDARLEELRNEVFMFTVRRDGAVVLVGQGTVFDAAGAVAARVPIGQLAPGEYEVVVESAKLGVVRAEREVVAGSEAVWHIER